MGDRVTSECAYDPCEKPRYAKLLCRGHYNQQWVGQELRPLRRRRVDNPGDWREWYLHDAGYIARARLNPETGKQEYQLEHREVMKAHLGRDLYPGENVHHINGDRADNRIENLELWSTSQPAGQRVEDKLRWAREILEKYRDWEVTRA